MKRLALLLGATAAVASVGLASPAFAHEPGGCEGHWYGTHGSSAAGQALGGNDIVVANALGVISIGGVAYVDDRNYVISGGNGLWIYAESNGEGGLQRGGITPSGEAEICQESTNPDMVIF